MKIAILNENCAGGGTEVQVRAEYDLLTKQGHQVWLVTYDPSYHGDSVVPNHINVLSADLHGLRKWVRQILGNHAFRERLQSVLASMAPDVIHLNNVFTCPRDVYKAVRPYPVVQTLRDYSVICPLDVCIGMSLVECSGYRRSSGAACPPALLTKMRHAKLAIINRMRTAAVDVMVSPSARLAQKCDDNGLEVTQLRDFIAGERIFKEARSFESRNFLYYGRLSKEKGVPLLLRVFEEFQVNRQTKLFLAGTIDDDFFTEFARYREMNWCRYLGHIGLAELREVYARVFCVVVPSVCMENYPNTAMEAMMNRTLVIGSNRGGLPEMLQFESLQFDVLDEASLHACLEGAYGMDKADYDHVTQVLFDRGVRENLAERYYFDLIGQFNLAMESFAEQARSRN